ncbi:hypothetical protein [Methylobacterium fujisawaense]|jgi:hypothetical protein
MPQTVLKEFSEEVVARSTRTIHVIEQDSGTIELWHEGVLVDTLTTYTDLGYALEAAPEVVERFRLTPASSLHVRVRACRKRGLRAGPGELRYGRRDYAETVGTDWSVLRRHVWDSHDGPMEAGRELALPFSMSAFHGAPDVRPDFGASDEALGLTVREIGGLPDELLWSGWGFGEVRVDAVDLIELEGRPAHVEAVRPSGRPLLWTQLRFVGVFVATVPAGIDADEAVRTLTLLEAEPGICSTRSSWPAWVGGRFYCGAPGSVHKWGDDPGAR